MAEKRRNRISNRITLKHVAEETGYSINTVSRALKNKSDISVATRMQIQLAAQALGYVNNAVASALRSGYTGTIAVILGDISNPHFSIMVKEIENEAQANGYSIIIINTDEDKDRERHAILSALSKQVDGVILCPTQKSSENIELLRNHIPFVLIGRHFSELETDYVVCNDEKGGYLATRHLIERNHTGILFLNGPGYISSAVERHAGYKRALLESSIGYDPDCVCEVPIKSGGCEGVLKEKLKNETQFTAIFAFSDLIAWESMCVLKRLGLPASKDIAVVGFDHIQARVMFPLRLTTIDSATGTMARRAVEILLNNLQGQSQEHEHVAEVVDVQLIQGEST